MLIAALLLQLPGLLPPVPAPRIAPDPSYQQAFQGAVAQGTIALDGIEELRPDGPAQEVVLLDALQRGDPAQLRLAALITAGSEADSRLSLAALHGAWHAGDEAGQLAVLLSPKAFPPAAWPALAWIALDRERPIGTRAAATGRLLRSGCQGAWPVARSFLRTGTAVDEQAPWADWNRLGRYELPKRLLVIEIDAWLQEAGEAPSGFEPNAAWAAQVEQLEALEPRIQSLLGRTGAVQDEALSRGIAALLRDRSETQERSQRAAGMLLPHASLTLQLALTKDDPALRFAAQRAFELAPR